MTHRGRPCWHEFCWRFSCKSAGVSCSVLRDQPTNQPTNKPTNQQTNQPTKPFHTCSCTQRLTERPSERPAVHCSEIMLEIQLHAGRVCGGESMTHHGRPCWHEFCWRFSCMSAGDSCSALRDQPTNQPTKPFHTFAAIHTLAARLSERPAVHCSEILLEIQFHASRVFAGESMTHHGRPCWHELCWRCSCKSAEDSCSVLRDRTSNKPAKPFQRSRARVQHPLCLMLLITPHP